MTTKFVRAAETWYIGATVWLSVQVSSRREDRDRGDVPGWVMITVMTAIVVIALLGVFRDQVTQAIDNAFNRVNKDVPK